MEDTQLELPVALKVMSAELAKDLPQRKRFRAEAKPVPVLRRPQTCVIREVVKTGDGSSFPAMEYLDSQTLEKVLAKNSPRLESVNWGLSGRTSVRTQASGKPSRK